MYYGRAMGGENFLPPHLVHSFLEMSISNPLMVALNWMILLPMLLGQLTAFSSELQLIAKNKY